MPPNPDRCHGAWPPSIAEHPGPARPLGWLILITHRLHQECPLRLRRCPGLCPPRPLDAGPAFFHISGHLQHPQTPPATTRAALGRPLLLGLKRTRPRIAYTDFVQSRAQVEVADWMSAFGGARRSLLLQIAGYVVGTRQVHTTALENAIIRMVGSRDAPSPGV